MGNLTACCPRPSNLGKPSKTTAATVAAPLADMPLALLDADSAIKPAQPLQPPARSPAMPLQQQQQLVAAAETAAKDARAYTDLSRVGGVYELFARYKEPTENAILVDGLQKFCTDLDVSPDDFRVLVLAWKFGAATMCCFTETEFVGGCQTLGVNSIASIKLKLPGLLEEVASERHFKDFYRWSYKFALESENGQRTLPTDLAVSLWKIVFSQHEPPILSRWLHFLEGNPSIKGIARDTWDMFLIFVDQIGENLGAYNDSEAWPSLLDDFVDSERTAAGSDGAKV